MDHGWQLKNRCLIPFETPFSFVLNWNTKDHIFETSLEAWKLRAFLAQMLPMGNQPHEPAQMSGCQAGFRGPMLLTAPVCWTPDRAPTPQWVSHRRVLSYRGLAKMLAQSHRCKSRQVSTFHQHFPEEISPLDFLDGELHSPPPPNQALFFSFLKKETLPFTETTLFLSGNCEGNLPTSSA